MNKQNILTAISIFVAVFFAAFSIHACNDMGKAERRYTTYRAQAETQIMQQQRIISRDSAIIARKGK